ncbi:MAG TPA: tripartite tricarboxylate transporter substrate binding protein [Xanthobacteraceae bacterium]|nr:tripartite tricarboxylate transporter substrate binding protein [Xanthobacteraceae bacterium]
MAGRRAAIGLFAGMFAVLAQHAPAQQNEASRRVAIVAPFRPGSTIDQLARALAAGMSQRLGQDLAVVNRPGNGGAAGTAEVAGAVADGQTLLFAPAFVLSVLPSARSEIGYAPQALAPVCQTFVNATAVVVRADSPFASLSDFVRGAREAAGPLRYGHPGPASVPHLAMEELLDAASVDAIAVSFSGDTGVLDGLRAGHVDVASVILGAADVENGDLRVIAVFAEERHPAFPEVETVKEQGFPILSTSFGGLFAPARTPPQVISRLAGACEWAARSEPYASTAKRLAQPENYYANVATFRHRLQRDIEVKRRLLGKLGAVQ